MMTALFYQDLGPNLTLQRSFFKCIKIPGQRRNRKNRQSEKLQQFSIYAQGSPATNVVSSTVYNFSVAKTQD